MAGRGIQFIPLRVPTQWSKEWFETFVRDVLAPADVRNAIEGGGISVTGNTDEPATIAASADVASLTALPYVLMALSGSVPNERKLTGSSTVAVTDGGAGGNVTLSIPDGSLPPNALTDFPGLSALVRRANSTGSPFPTVASLAGQVLRRGLDVGSADVVEFGALDLASANSVTGVLPDANIASTIARDSEVTAAIAAFLAAANTWPLKQTFQSPLAFPGYTVGTLPAGSVGDRAYCTDLLTPTFLSPAVGGGAVVGPVFRNATIWVVG